MDDPRDYYLVEIDEPTDRDCNICIRKYYKQSMKLMLKMLIDIYTDEFPFEGDYEDESLETLENSLDMIINSYRKKSPNRKNYYPVSHLRYSYYEFSKSYLERVAKEYVENPTDPDRFIRNIEKIIAKLITEDIEPESESTD